MRQPKRPSWTPFQKGETHYGGQMYRNSRYVVVKRHCGHSEEAGNLWHLSIKNLGNTADHDWRDYQRIKNELVGPEAEGVELYPAHSRLVDNANQFHLWVFDGAGFRFPFGFAEQLITPDTHKMDGTEQREMEG